MQNLNILHFPFYNETLRSLVHANSKLQTETLSRELHYQEDLDSFGNEIRRAKHLFV